MGRIYRNLKPIPVPKDCYVAKNTKKVQRYYYLNGVRKYHVVGCLTDDGLMLPNDVFRTHFPREWNEAYGETVPAARKIKAGMYGLALGIGLQTGLYPAVQEAFGLRNGNIVMDLAMHLVVNHGNARMRFDEAMEKYVLFSRNAWSPAFISQFLSSEMTDEHACRFRDLWLKKCVQEGRRQVWLCIDGSDVDSLAPNPTPAISLVWAVDAMDGRPITWFVNEANTPCRETLDGALRHFDETGLDVRGAIVDRGFATQNVLELLEEKGLDYIVMLGKNAPGFTQMLDKHRDELFMNIGLSLDVDDEVFGTVDRTELFHDSRKDAHVALYFSPREGIDRSLSLLKEINDAGKTLKEQIKTGKKNIEAVDEMRNFISAVPDEDGEVKDIARNPNAFRSAIRSHGYFAIASSQARDASEILAIYRLRHASEVQFDAMKTQLGFRWELVHTDESVRSCVALAFVSIIVRNEIGNACRKIGLETDSAIRDVDNVSLTRMTSGEYEPAYDCPDDIGLLLESFGVRAGHFKVFAEELNHAANAAVNAVKELGCSRNLPELDVPRRPGRRKGSKNRKTLEREAREAELRARGELPPKRRPGRPKGSKNLKTLEREAREAELRAKGELPPKRGPGRPKGSKNRKTLEREAREAEMLANAEKEQEYPAAGGPHGEGSREIGEEKGDRSRKSQQ